MIKNLSFDIFLTFFSFILAQQITSETISAISASASTLCECAVKDASETGIQAINFSNTICQTLNPASLLLDIPAPKRQEFLENLKSTFESATQLTFLTKQCGGNPFSKETTISDMQEAENYFKNESLKELQESFVKATTIDFEGLKSLIDDSCNPIGKDIFNNPWGKNVDEQTVRHELLSACKLVTQAVHQVVSQFKVDVGSTDNLTEVGNGIVKSSQPDLENFVSEASHLILATRYSADGKSKT